MLQKEDPVMKCFSTLKGLGYQDSDDRHNCTWLLSISKFTQEGSETGSLFGVVAKCIMKM